MELYAQLVVNGITNGAVYGLLAAGFVLVYRASKVLNFAQAGMGAVGAYLLFDVMKGTGGGTGRYLGGFVLGVAAAAVIGVLTERLAVRPLRKAPALAPLIATVGVLLLLQSLIILRWGGDLRSIPNPLPKRPWHIGRAVGLDGLVVNQSAVLTLVVMVVLVSLLTLVVTRTRWGLTVRSISDNADGAAGLGVRIGRVSGQAWALGAAVGAVASLLAASTTILNPYTLFLLQIKALVVGVFAGLKDLRLCLLGGPLLGIVESLAGSRIFGHQIAGLSDSVGFFALVAVLILRSATITETLGDTRAS
ncbi:MAG TPA: branched-chain amino acid ABC transporter permease [Acidimicrobiia bacterium]|nr:branched-chain amino acid ABC transporter permease [Acidimicrobiia bacterium]